MEEQDGQNKIALNLYKLIEGIIEHCVLKSSNSHTIINVSEVEKYHSYLNDYSKLLSDERLLDFKVPDSALFLNSSGFKYYWLEPVKFNLEQSLIYLRSEYDIDLVLKFQDKELNNRCVKLFLDNSGKYYDTLVREATTILENRIKNKSQHKGSKVGVNLVDEVLKNDVTKTVLYLGNSNDEHSGLTHICRGVFSAFRNETHHKIIEDLLYQDALKVCGLVDILLNFIDNSKKNN